MSKDLKVLEAEELNYATETISVLDQLQMNLGGLELNKSNLLNQFLDTEAKFNEFKEAMVEKYGENMNINLQTGELTKSEA
jgi:hypothetical protein